MSHQDDQLRAQKAAQSLQSLTTSLSNLSSSSRTIPSDKDFHFYYNFPEFNLPIRKVTAFSDSALESIGSSRIWTRPIEYPVQEDVNDNYDWLNNVNDEALESFDMSVDDVEKKTDNGFQLVSGKKKRSDSLADSLSVKVKDKKGKVPFHIATIKRPQEEYNIIVNNSNMPFQHVWLQRSDDGQRLIHPLEKLSVLDFVDKEVGDVDPVKPPPIEETPFKMVQEVRDLKELAAKLQNVNEFAVDLEHNQYRSFQGMTCLIQISTRTEDFVVDTLKLRIHVGPYLREVFKDPTKKKVMHGADRDVVWLQRDFGIYICNMFDTGQASRVLKLERNSLEYLLQHFCEVAANKEYQNADWRLRPLPEEMMRYAREDTHYLLYIYDLMKIKLSSMPKESESADAPLVEVYKRSYDVCMQLYEKELLTENSYLYIYGLQSAGLNAHQLAVVSGLCEWRDAIARADDESTGYVLPNKTLIEIAKQMPLTPNKLRRALKLKHPYIERNLGTVVGIIRNSLQNAAAFEAAAQQLKEGRIDASQENLSVTDEPELLSPGTSQNLKSANFRRESMDGASALGVSSIPQQQPYSVDKKESLKPGSSVARLDSGTPSMDQKANGESRDADPSPKVASATVQAVKKPSRGFGALFGPPKKKSDTEKKDQEANKLEQIRSSVNLPFRSFAANNEQPKQVAEEQTQVSVVSQAEEHPAVSASRSNAENFIQLDDDSDEEKSKQDSLQTTEPSQVENSLGPVLDEEENEPPMSLADLSTSFEQCVNASNKKKNGKAEKSDDSFPELKPYDFAAARKQIKFGEAESVGNEENKRSAVKSGDKKKGSAVGTDEQLAQGKRRLAFPATGNRSATFR